MKLSRVTFIEEDTQKPHLAEVLEELDDPSNGLRWIRVRVPELDPVEPSSPRLHGSGHEFREFREFPESSPASCDLQSSEEAGRVRLGDAAQIKRDLPHIAGMIRETDEIMRDALREEAGVCPDPLEPESAIKEWPELRHVLAHLWGAIESLAGSRPADALDDLASIASQVFWPADDDEREEAISMSKHTHKGGKRPKKNPCKGR